MSVPASAARPGSTSGSASAPTSGPTSGPSAGAPWWRSAVTYQIYIRSFADADGDGLGDVAGIRSRLPHLDELGVDAIWINPWYPSPQADGGYDVADYRDIDATFGTREEAEALIADAHARGIRVLLDIVPNHTSDEHPWFVEALAAGPGSPERERYIFRSGAGPDGARPPNDWTSAFGGPAWRRVTEPDGAPGEWYLHLFDAKQPDLNWDNPVVQAEFESILRFWFDRGVDGFRIDVAHGLIKDPALPDLGQDGRHPMETVGGQGHPHWDRPGVHEIYRAWRKVADSYDPPRVFVAEAWVTSAERLAAYVRPDELHTAFDFDFVRAAWNAPALRATVTSSLAAHDSVGAPVMWVLSNHDIARHVTRLGRPSATRSDDPLHGHDAEDADPVLGRRRARAALLLELALPGGVYLYQGEELGLEEVEDLADEFRQDPVFLRTGGDHRGRDGCRVPLPWTSSGPSLGFGTAPGWLPQPAGWGGPLGLSVQVEAGDPSSMLAFYTRALRLRHELSDRGVLGAGDASSLTWSVADGPLADAVVAFTRPGGFACVVNTGGEPVRLADAVPAGFEAARVLLASDELAGDQLPSDTAVWLSV